MSPPIGSPVADVSPRALLRQLATLLPGVEPSGALPGVQGSPLEAFRAPDELPRLVSAAVLEGRELRARSVPSGDVAPFDAFLDGTQQSHVLWYAPRGVPIIHGAVGAVIRARSARRLRTWRHEVTARLYVPRAILSAAWRDALAGLGIEVVDTSVADGGSAPLVEHPAALRDAAIHRVQADREAAEHRLGARWCETDAGWLLVDGGISGSDRLATSARVTGVVKSHRTLYAEGAALDTVFGLAAGERTSVCRIASPLRTAVASWYLRLRDASGRDPMWGLVRLEMALSESEARTGRGLAERADEASRRVLAEVSPVALPDARWDRMVYGIRDCEQFLRSVM